MAGRPPLRIGAHGKITRIDLGDGIWLARCRFRDDDGIVRIVERRTPHGVDDKYGAKAEGELLDSLEGRRAPGDGQISDRTLLTAVCKLHLQRLEDEGRSTATIDTYNFAAEKVKTWTAGIRVGECTPGRMDSVLRAMAKTHGPTMARQAKTILRGGLSLAVLQGVLETNPVREVSAIKSKAAPKGARAFTGNEIRKMLLDLYADEYFIRNDIADPVTLFIATGLRRSELLGVLWSDIDEEARTVRVTGKVVRVKGQGLVRFAETKSDAGARTIALPQFAMAMLKRRGTEPHPSDDGVVFPSTTGTLRDPNNFGKQWRVAREKLGVPETTSHSFRKSIATLIDDDGLSARIGADHLGHRHVSMTQDVYMTRGRVHPEVADLLDRVAISDE
ncbi:MULTISPECIES: site-specific integrase [Actinomycetes]|uniref:site-specific integrase n=1 Tax=Actinomycetes TaxID=1760 RepID=UPI0004C0D4C6|nr:MULTISPECIES: site-specific integrase [Actinomycetes]